ncbi:lipopolysaccharide biosynthesis protein [Radicibacter daui]|uniref:lipopolysaccharide biosynthesis protein n=1 Tax=Radicibacter daui TaxID=3064829 RepID=UPI004046D011
MIEPALGRWRRLVSPREQTRRLKGLLEARPFLRNVSIMLSGSAGGQMVSILLSPLLTRLYTPQQFGILSVYSALLTILVVIASLRYELALPLARTDRDALNLVGVCGGVLLVTTAAIGLVAFLVPTPVVQALWTTPPESSELLIYRGLLVLGYFCLGGYYIALQLATRASAFPAIAKTRLAQGVVGPIGQIGLALLGAGTPGLLIGNILGQSAGTFGLFGCVITRLRSLLEALSWRRMIVLARRYVRFPLISSWAALIDAAGSSQLLYLLAAVAYSPHVAGFIFLVERVVSRPLNIVGTSILQVYIGEAGRIVASDPAALKRRFRQVVSRQFMMAVAWVLVANIAGSLLFATVFGQQWEEGIFYLRALSIGYLAQAVVQPVFHTLQILEKQGLAAGWQIGRLVLTVTVFMAGTRLGLEPWWGIAGYSAAQALCCLVLILIMVRAIDARRKQKEMAP